MTKGPRTKVPGGSLSITDPQLDVIVWDSEALVPKEDWEDWGSYKARAGVSVACVIDATTGIPTYYTSSDRDEYNLEALAGRLQSADEVVSYNGKSWDTPVLSEALGRPIFVRERDLYVAIRRSLNGTKWPQGSWKLGRVAGDTIGVGKTGNGANAPTLWREEEYGRIFSYVHRDAWITWRVWAFVREHGYVVDPNGGHLEVDLYG